MGRTGVEPGRTRGPQWSQAGLDQRAYRDEQRDPGEQRAIRDTTKQSAAAFGNLQVYTRGSQSSRAV